jgi:predicted secreted protein
MESMHPMKKKTSGVAGRQARAAVLRALTLCASVCVSLAFVTACSTPVAPPPPPPKAPIQNPGKASLVVTDANADAKIVLDPAQALVVRLPLIPTDGYEWSLVDLKPGVLMLVDSQFERTRRDLDAFENPGETVFRLSAAAAGEVTLNFWLRKPRSLEPAVRVVSFTAMVK